VKMAAQHCTTQDGVGGAVLGHAALKQTRKMEIDCCEQKLVYREGKAWDNKIQIRIKLCEKSTHLFFAVVTLILTQS